MGAWLKRRYQVKLELDGLFENLEDAEKKQVINVFYKKLGIYACVECKFTISWQHYYTYVGI